MAKGRIVGSVSSFRPSGLGCQSHWLVVIAAAGSYAASSSVIRARASPAYHTVGCLVLQQWLSCQVLAVQASNILGVETRPFSAETHEYEEEEYEDPVTGEVRVRLNNLIRWRHVTQPDGVQLWQLPCANCTECRGC